jgi:hypothetical protein
MTTLEEREDLTDHILGSGALSYPWYAGCSINLAENLITIVIDEDKVTYFTNFDNLLDAAHQLYVLNTNTAVGDDTGYTRRGLWDISQMNFDEADIDADVADLIIQQAIFGEVVYS